MPKGVYIRRNLNGKNYIQTATKEMVKADVKSGMTHAQTAKKWQLTQATVRHIMLGDWNPTRTRNKKLKDSEFKLIAEERERCAQIMEAQFGEGNYLAQLIRKEKA